MKFIYNTNFTKYITVNRLCLVMIRAIYIRLNPTCVLFPYYTRCFIGHNAPTTGHYRLLIATNNKLFLVIFTRELQTLERMIQVTNMTSTRLVENY